MNILILEKFLICPYGTYQVLLLFLTPLSKIYGRQKAQVHLTNRNITGSDCLKTDLSVVIIQNCTWPLLSRL